MEFADQDGVVCLSRQLRCVTRLMTTLRDRNTAHRDFVLAANRLMSLVCEEGLSHVQGAISAVKIQTPTDSVCDGEVIDFSNIVVVSVIRAGDAMLDCFLRMYPDVFAGKILIQRNEVTALPQLFYSKLPKLEGKQIILVDPMLATGGSAKMAVQVLVEHGACVEKIAFFNVVACPEGITAMRAAYPTVKIVTAEIDTGLNEKAYILPGLGDYGDRFYGTTH